MSSQITSAAKTNDSLFHKVADLDLGIYWCENHFVTGDFDKNGEMDLIALATTTRDTAPPFTYDWKVLHFQNNGNWEMDSTNILSGQGYGYDIKQADMNSDGWLDLVVMASDQGTRVLLNDQHGGFQIAWTGGLRYSRVEVADVNLDQRMDLVYGTQVHDSSGQIRVWLADDSLFTFNEVWQSRHYGSANGTVQSFKLADLNGDSYPDFVGSEIYDGQIIVLENDSAGLSFKEGYVYAYPAFSRVFALDIGNINGDSIPDFATYAGWGSAFTYASQGLDTMEEVWPSPNMLESSICLDLEDVNQDGWSDLFYGTFQTGKVRLFQNNTAGGFDLIWEHQLNEIMFNGQVAHLNKDQLADLVIGGRNSLSIYLQESMNTSLAALALREVFLSVHPNPARDQLKVVLHSDISVILAYRILNMRGKEVFNRKVSHTESEHKMEITIPISHLPPGMYLLQAIGEQGIMGSKKWIKID